MRAGLGHDVHAVGARPADLLDSLAARDMDDEYRHICKLRERNGAVRGLALHQHWARDCVIAGGGAAAGFQALGQPLDAVGILGMDHGRGIVFASHVQNIENLTVIELQIVIGHVDLEGGVAFPDQRGQFVFQYFRGGVADDHVETIVHTCFAFCAAMVVGHGCAQGLAFGLGGKGDDRGGAAAGCSAGAAFEVVCHAHGRFHGLIQMAVGIDTARCDHSALSVVFVGAGRQLVAQLGDLAVADADVGFKDVTGGCDLRIAHHDIEFAGVHVRGRFYVESEWLPVLA